VRIKIDNIEVEITPGETILEAARQAGLTIPTLCYNKAFGGKGHCRMCMVEVTFRGSSRLVASCTYPIYSEIEVRTSTPAIEKIRRTIIMLLTKHATGSELMNDLYKQYQCTDNSLTNHFEERCILCRLCVNACEQMGSHAISAILRGTEKRIATPYDEPADTCIGCGACAEVCPTGAIELTQQGKQRIIWNKTFEMVNCSKCGKPFATREQLQYLAAQGNPAVTDGAPLCEGCRRKQVASRLNQFTV
jgi:bidirectional [NiFe] hydrogenase diaphorase subunit